MQCYVCPLPDNTAVNTLLWLMSCEHSMQAIIFMAVGLLQEETLSHELGLAREQLKDVNAAEMSSQLQCKQVQLKCLQHTFSQIQVC